jgi:hypothetical protein
VQTPEEKRAALHDKVQMKLKEFCAKSRQTRKKELHRQALLARIHADTDLLISK